MGVARLGILALVSASVAIASGQTGSGYASDISEWLSSLAPRNLGPTTMGGRITDLAVYAKEPRIFYAATASGGLYKTINGGSNFTPVFDKENTISLGAAAVSQQNPDVVWVGTGEATSRNSVAWGDGVYKSVDGGKTWKHMGLKETMHIGKVVIDPRNDDVVYVAALGRLWGRNPERGVYKTTDGGKTWQHVLKLDVGTGAIDLIIDPKRPDTLLVAMWGRERKAYDFASGSPASGIYKTTNAGRSWRRIEKGLPKTTLGRIGLDIHLADPRKLVASVEYRPDPNVEKNRPRDQGTVKQYGGGTFVSEDGGESWTMVNPLNPRPFYFSIPKIDPQDPKRMYISSDSYYLSTDGGKKFDRQPYSVHPDGHVLWINPRDSHHILMGTDGGVFQTRDQGQTWQHLNGMAIGQYYAVGVDMRRPYWIYGGLQDNSNWGIPTQTSYGNIQYFHSVPLGGGDGFYNLVDPDDWTTVYSESQGGAVYRTDLVNGGTKFIRPRVSGETLRFNWNTPFVISPHNSKTLYLGGNRLFKTVNRGDAWTPISGDLTTNDPRKLSPGKFSVTPEDTGAERHCTIVTISESPRLQGTLYVGTDDGLVHVTRDDGRTWSDITPNIPDLPKGIWCSRVVASKHADGRAYVTFDGHRSDNFKPYVYVTEDFGKTFKPLTTGIPDGDSMYVIREGVQNADLLFLGSELGLRISLNRGQSWTRYRTGGFPTVAVHDLVIHPRELDLVIGTHGRSIWTVDVSALEQFNEKVLAEEARIFAPQDVLDLGRIGGSQWNGTASFLTPNTQPGTRIHYWLKEAAKEAPTLVITSPSGTERAAIRDVPNKAGLNVVTWNGRIGGQIRPGDYRATLTVNGKEYVTSVKVVPAGLTK
jgi:photosystem II stability/assembly factor-like uncharacterized protein